VVGNTANPAGTAKVSNLKVTPSPARPDEPAQYEQFEALTRKLVQVPKAELDKKRREG
jgi:hypothetical protein